jgi:hypothetical protein
VFCDDTSLTAAVCLSCWLVGATQFVPISILQTQKKLMMMMMIIIIIILIIIIIIINCIYFVQIKMNSPQPKNIITESKDNCPKKPYTANTHMTSANKWLTSADLFAETEGFLTAIQDQVTLTRNYKKCILKQPNSDELCRRCGKEWETIQQITAACEQLAATKYVKRHDGVAKGIHQKMEEAAELIEDKSP